MTADTQFNNFDPNNAPLFFNGAPKRMRGKVYNKVIIKDDYIRTNGTCALYLLLRINGRRKKIALNIAVKPASFNKKTQRIKGVSQLAKDCNILIEKSISRINDIELTYRLSNKVLDVETLVEEFTNPTPAYDFIKFYEFELKNQERFLKPGTYRQQKATLNKLKLWKSHIAFSAINDILLKELKLHCKNVLKNQGTTVASTLKNFKKYLHLANKKGIATSLKFDDIKVPVFKGQRTYLTKDEIVQFYNYWNSDFISQTHKNVLSKFLFSVFTSLRISDIQAIERDQIIVDHLVYNSKKTGKFNKVKLSASAKQFIQTEGPLFLDCYSGEYINRELKEISLLLGIRKKVTFHVARHTFATQYIINGGNVVNLQRAMDHSNIRETMIYVHIVDQLMNDEIDLLDNILN